MNVSLTPQLEAIIRQKVESGHFNSASEVVRQALRLLDAEDRREEWLRAKMADAEIQVRNGEVVEMTATFWDDLDREVDDRIAQGDTPSSDVCP
ncbi:MAG: type II toxin-antitoxin system ParD family antitoxin [Thermomicrobiales bacterium]